MQDRRFLNTILFILAVSALYFMFIRVRDYSAKSLELDKIVTEDLYKNGVTEKGLFREVRDVERRGRKRYLHITKEIYVTSSFPLRKYAVLLEDRLKKAGFRLFKSDFYVEKAASFLKVEISYRRLMIYSLILKRGLSDDMPAYVAGGANDKRLAIVIDDWGYNMKNLDTLISISRPITAAILPNLRYSAKIADKAYANNIECILHLPLESHDSAYAKPEQDTINTGMKNGEVERLLDKAIASVPHIKGVSNHMGSKATEDEGLMRSIFNDLKKRKLYFLDSLVINKSVCQEISREAGIRFAKRDTFLDNEDDADYIKAQIDEAVKHAEENGSAVAIGHARPLTLSAIKDKIGEIEARGVRLVFLSELVK